MLSNKINNINDWLAEGKLKNTKLRSNPTDTSINLTNPTKQGLFFDSKSYKTFKSLYDEYKNYGLLDVYNNLTHVWNNTDNSNLNLFRNHLLATAVYLDVDPDWLKDYTISMHPFWKWFNQIGGVKRPSMNINIDHMKYQYFKTYLLSLLNI